MRSSKASEQEQLAPQAGRRLEIPPLDQTAFYGWAQAWLERPGAADDLFQLLLPVRMTRAEWCGLIKTALAKGQALHQTFAEFRRGLIDLDAHERRAS